VHHKNIVQKGRFEKNRRTRAPQRFFYELLSDTALL